MIFDCFLFFNEVDLLQCRLEELSGAVDRFIIVEAGENHQGRKRASLFLRNEARFSPWRNKIEYVWVPELAALTMRKKENEQRERFRDGLTSAGAMPDDIVIQSDLDEIPSRASVLGLADALERYPILAFEQSPHYFAVDWLHPRRCGMAPAACRLSDVTTFTEMRHASEGAPAIPNAGWHFSWLGTPAEHVEKLSGIYEGPELYQRCIMDLVTGKNWREGVHVDGVKMTPIDIDDTFPVFIRERRCPPHWFRPR